jgi:hypothetical protein
MSTRRNYIKLRYWVNILLMPETRLVKAIYNHSKLEYTIRNKTNWTTTIHSLVCFQKYELTQLWVQEEAIHDHDIPQENVTIDAVRRYWLQKIYDKVHNIEEREWKVELEKKPKLRTYKTVKSKLELEPYLLTEKNRRGRNIMTALRTGSSRLRIETGRWKKPKEAEKDRICLACMSGRVEDEKHFLLFCSAYEQLRQKMHQSIYDDTLGDGA